MAIFEYTFFQNAVICSLLASIACGFVGTYIVARRLVFISGGVTHASLGGVGLGVVAGLNPLYSALAFSALSALGIQWMSSRHGVREDSAIALFWTLGMSIGILCCFLTPGFMPDLQSYLFGSILAIGTSDLVVLAVVAATATAVFTLLHETIVAVGFDAQFARSQHLPVAFIEYAMMVLIAVTVVSVLRMVGIVLALSLLTVPQMTANIFTTSFRRICWLCIAIGWGGCLCGLALSYGLNVPSGATIIFSNIVIYALCKAIKRALNELNKSEVA